MQTWRGTAKRTVSGTPSGQVHTQALAGIPSGITRCLLAAVQDWQACFTDGIETGLPTSSWDTGKTPLPPAGEHMCAPRMLGQQLQNQKCILI